MAPTRTYASTAEMRATYGAARTRLMRPSGRGVVSDPAAPARAEPRAARPSLATVPAIADIVDALCEQIGLAREGLLTDVRSDVAVEARKIAAALVVRRLPITRAAAAEHFGIPEDSIAGALARIDLTLVARAIPRNADLAQTVSLVLADWELHHDLRPTVPDIKRAVCTQFGVTRAEIESARREARLVVPRHFAMALARHVTARSLPFIGRHFGGCDHSTVMHAVRKMQPVIAAIAQRLGEHATPDEWARAGREALNLAAAEAKASGGREPG
jgi:chromosomal replication initiation ATPase DnaA